MKGHVELAMGQTVLGLMSGMRGSDPGGQSLYGQGRDRAVSARYGRGEEGGDAGQLCAPMPAQRIATTLLAPYGERADRSIL